MPRKRLSESKVLAQILASAKRILRASPENSLLTELALDIEVNAHALLSQVSEGVHRNPPLVIFGNPPRQGREFGTDVLALLYRHKKDGEFYCHGFGNADIQLEGTPFEGVTIHRLKERTGVKLIAMPDGTVVLSKPGTDLWEDIKS